MNLISIHSSEPADTSADAFPTIPYYTIQRTDTVKRTPFSDSASIFRNRQETAVAPAIFIVVTSHYEASYIAHVPLNDARSLKKAHRQQISRETKERTFVMDDEFLTNLWLKTREDLIESGNDPDAMLLSAAETVDAWRLHGLSDVDDIDEDDEI